MKNTNVNIVFPGNVLLEEFLRPRGISQTKLALDIRVPVNRINEIINGKREITADTAIRLGKYFGNEAEFWLHLQANYNISTARELIENELKYIPYNHEVEKKITNICNCKKYVISLFSGAGGLDIGFEQAGFQIAVAVEADSACCQTLQANRPRLKIINKKIEEVSSEEILKNAGLQPLACALVIGGPPCQSFSLAGARKGLNDDRGKLLFEFVRIVRETLPVGFVMENVKGLANWDSGKALQMLLNELRKPILFAGKEYKYTVPSPQVLNAVDYGVPQYRERIIIVGNREGKSFSYPPPTTNKKNKTVWDAIGQLPSPDNPSETALRVAETIKERRNKHGY